MSQSRIQQPGGSDSSELQNQIQMPTIENSIEEACRSSKSGYEFDETALKMLTRTPDRILQFLQTDTQHIAHAEENFIDEYFIRLREFLKVTLNRTNKDIHPNHYNLIIVIQQHYLNKLKGYTRKLRKTSSQRLPKVTLKTALLKWGNIYNLTDSFPSLTVIPGDETYKPHDKKPPPLETSAFSTKRNRSKRHSETIAVLTAHNPTQPAETPYEQIASTQQQTLSQAEVQAPTSKVVPIHVPTKRAKKNHTGTSLNMPVVRWVPEDEAPASESAPEPKVTSLVETQPEIDSWDYAVLSPEKKLEEDTKLFKQKSPGTTTEIFQIRQPSSEEEWEITLQNLETAMIASFEPLRKLSSTDRPFDEIKEREILQLLINALSKTGTPEYRKRILQEVHEVIKSLEKDPKKQRRIISIFALALTSVPDFKQPRTPSSTMTSIYSQPNGSEPNPEDLTSAALTKSFENLTEADIYDMPKELQRPVLELLTISRNLGFSNYGYGVRATEPKIEKMNPGAFKLMCMHILNKLQEVESHVKWKPFSRETWKKGPTGKARRYTASLRKILVAQMTIMEELMFSEELLIPTNHS